MDEPTGTDQPPRKAWPSDFPAVVVNIEYCQILQHTDYPMAKAGAAAAAERLVTDLEIHLASTTLARLNARHPRLSTWWQREFGHDLDALTEGEAGHLLKAASVDAIRDRIVAARRRAGVAGNKGPDGSSEGPQATGRH